MAGGTMANANTAQYVAKIYKTVQEFGQKKEKL